MKRDFEIKIIRAGRVDTRKYRYIFKAGCSNPIAREAWQIKRIRTDSIGTTATLSDKSDTNPNGWEVIKTGF